MPTTPGTRKKEATHPTRTHAKGALKLMQTAERLFGEHGIDGVSLRQIVSAAGQANSSAVQHHFGTKEGLIQAVYDMRLPALDDARRARLESAKDANGYVSVPQLLKALFMPVAENLDEAAQKSYAQFNSRLMQVDIAKHPFTRSRVPQPAHNDIEERLKSHLGYLPEGVFQLRLRLATELFFAALSEYRRLDQNRPGYYRVSDDYWTEILQMIESLLRTPYTATHYKTGPI